MPDLPAVSFGMVEFGSTFALDRVKVYPQAEGGDIEGGTDLIPDEEGAVTIACQVSQSRTTAMVSGMDGTPAPAGDMLYDIMFGRAAYMELVDGGLIAEGEDGARVARYQQIDWVSDRHGEKVTPLVMTSRGAVDEVKGIGSRYAITAMFRA